MMKLLLMGVEVLMVAICVNAHCKWVSNPEAKSGEEEDNAGFF